jgi:ADP-heptose:LPS heptosyltransferase
LWPLLKETYTPKTLPFPQVKLPTEAEQLLLMPFLLQEAVEGVHKQHILLHPGVSQAGLKKGINKTWSASAWAELILQLSRDHFVYLTGGPDDTEMVAAIEAALPSSLKHFANLVGKTKSFAELATLMSLMDAIVCVDSAPLHLAVGLNKPTVALFGPTNEKKLTPPNSPFVKTVSVEGLSCRPCLWHNRKQNCDTSTCLTIEPKYVVKALEELLGVSFTWAGSSEKK